MNDGVDMFVGWLVGLTGAAAAASLVAGQERHRAAAEGHDGGRVGPGR